MANFSSRVAIVLLSLLFSATSSAQANQDTYFQHQNFGYKEGLGHTYFSGKSECVQDSLGFFWISGISGLYKFDCNKFEFIHKDNFNLTGNGQFQLNVDAKGNSWIFKNGFGRVDSIDPIMVNLLTREITHPNFKVVGAPALEYKKYFSGIESGGGKLFAWDIDNNVFEISGDDLYYKGSILRDYLIEDIIWIEDCEEVIVLTEEGICFRTSHHTDGFTRLDLPYLIMGISAGSSGVMLCSEMDSNYSPKSSIYYYDLLIDSLFNLPYSGLNGDMWILGGDGKNEWIIRETDNIHFLRSYGNGDIKASSSWPHKELFPNQQEPSRVSIVNNQYWFLFGKSIKVIQFKPKQFAAHLIEEKKVSVRSILNVGDSLVLFNTYRGERMLDISSLKKKSTLNLDGLKWGGYGLMTGEDGNLYSGLHGWAIWHFDPLTQRSELLPFKEEDKVHETGALIPFADSTGKIWVGLEKGLAYLDAKDNKLSFVTKDKVPAIAEASFNSVTPAYDSSHFWLATSDGAFLFDPYNENIIEDLPRFRGKNVTVIRQYSRDSIWVISLQGDAFIWDKKTNVWDSLNVFKLDWKNNLHDILPDKMGGFWLPSNNGLIRYDSSNKNFIRLNSETDGLPFNEFNRLASLALPDGRLIFGGIDGAISINPKTFSLAHHNGITPNNRVRVSKVTTISRNKEIELSLPLNPVDVINIESGAEQAILYFAYLDPMKPPCKYYYRLRKGDWFELDEPQVILSELSYNLRTIEFKVVESGTGRFLGQTSVMLQKEKPWYLKSITVAGYFLTALILLHFFFRWRVGQIVKKNNHLEELISQRTEELSKDRAVIREQRDDLKQFTKTQQRLFSIIGHELRGPLLATVNLRQTMSYLLKKRRYEDLDKVALQLKRQAEETNLAVDQLLQWGRMAVYDTPPDISTFFLKELTTDVLSSMQKIIKDKQLNVSCTMADNLQVSFDQGAMKILLRNFVHNAIKFSPVGGSIEIRHLEEEFRHSVTVIDEGAGVEDAALQSWNAGDGFPLKTGSAGEKGTGLGLMICKKIAEKNKGSISLSQRLSSKGALASLSWKK